MIAASSALPSWARQAAWPAELGETGRLVQSEEIRRIDQGSVGGQCRIEPAREIVAVPETGEERRRQERLELAAPFDKRQAFFMHSRIGKDHASGDKDVHVARAHRDRNVGVAQGLVNFPDQQKACSNAGEDEWIVSVGSDRPRGIFLALNLKPGICRSIRLTEPPVCVEQS
ncbi:hypothetical protein [Ensifer sp. 1H6]|uniref:hypothetical protein n=1 Tax=Ensifer sp. 1H6 TaxID=1911585 RepID=UPI0009CA9DA7|nr:hypothetical protein [Ensifer sp. 1H6]OMQ43471.1 hypothetical protein BKP54_17285 [Ensifer sp. 1H6]